MKELNGDHRAVRTLLRMHHREGRPAPERLEENLRWLVQITMPPVKAPERLRRRVQAIADAHRVWLLQQCAEQEELRRWPGLAEILAEPEQEMLSLLLTAELGPVANDPLLRAEARRLMQRLLQGLPELLREALLLQMVQGLSLREIAQVLDCSEGEASVWLHQLRLSIFQQAESEVGNNDLHERVAFWTDPAQNKS